MTIVTATKGEYSACSIGNSYQASCGTVYYDGSAFQNGGDTNLATSPVVYPAP
ncbi:MAG: hypothetical protein IJP74_02010 [Prevotella sp.]|nr:hypothetical protein [Prevotella sp.]